VVLANDFELAAFRPIALFNVWNAHYSHPAGLFDARSRFLRRLASEDDPAVVAAALRKNRYDAVDMIELAPAPAASSTRTTPTTSRGERSHRRSSSEPNSSILGTSASRSPRTGRSSDGAARSRA